MVLITCSIHATELASTQTAVEFAYRLLTEDTPRFRAILQNTILLLVPSLNPDGVDIVTRWYRRTLGTPFEGTGPPELYQKYVGHDNNRDWYMFTQTGNATDHRQAAQRLASPDRLRRAPEGPQRRAPLRAAVARPDRAQHRRHRDAGNEHDRHGHGCRPDRRRAKGRRHPRDLRFLDALARTTRRSTAACAS